MDSKISNSVVDGTNLSDSIVRNINCVHDDDKSKIVEPNIDKLAPSIQHGHTKSSQLGKIHQV